MSRFQGGSMRMAGAHGREHGKLRAARLRERWRDHPLAMDFRRIVRPFTANGLAGPLATLFGASIALTLSVLWLALSSPPHWGWISLQLGLIAIAAVAQVITLWRLRQRFLLPLANVRSWALRMRGGNLSARMPAPKHGEFLHLANDLNSLGEELKTLSKDLDREVRRQIQRIENKNRSLEILYDVAASINTSRDLDDLLRRFLITLAGVTNAQAATVRLLGEDDQMELVASIGLDERVVRDEARVSVQRCLCGQALQSGKLMAQGNVRQCAKYTGGQFLPDENVEMIAVPLQYRGRNLGVYNLFVPKPGLFGREDIQNLLTSIGRHLGMAIEKARLDEESKRLSIHRERALLSHELHDSLAQTLASLRFQVRMLDETVGESDNTTARREVSQLKNGVDEAYAELRELLAHFRAPFDERGLISAIEKVIERFRKETDILIFFQHDWKLDSLPSVLEMQVLRIIQEALNNVRKHSGAHAVRVMLRSEPSGVNTVLIEDDGAGLGKPARESSPGEHIGLSIMEERAHRLGGKLNIESEPGEGTRVMLSFRHDPQSQRDLLELI